MIPHESGTFFTGGQFNNDIGPVTGYPTSGHTTAWNGTFHDVPFGVCGSGAFGFLSATQTISMRVGNSSYSVRLNSWIVSGNSIGHGSLSNDNDVDVDRP